MEKGPKISFPRRGSGASQYEAPKTSEFGIGSGVRKNERSKRYGIHGIGGGMRVDAESLLSPSFNRAWLLTKSSLSTPRIVFGVYLSIMVAVLSLAHIHLRFQIHDYSIQQTLLQKTHRELKMQREYLVRTNNNLSDLNKLKDHAVHNLKMEPIIEAEYIPTAAESREKYSQDSRQQAYAKVNQTDTMVAGTKDTNRTWGFAQLNTFIDKYVP